jgi:hypothetical protein
MIIALPQWLVLDGEPNPDFLDDDGSLFNCSETEDLYEGWTESITDHCRCCCITYTIEVLHIRPLLN